MKRTIVFILLTCCTGLFSCKEEKKEEGMTQMQEVMAIHDEVMPKMGEIGRLVGQLKPMVDSLGTDSPEGKAMRNLQDANKAMMDWMQGIGERFDADEIMKGKELTEEKQQWLNEEEEKVKVVKDKINTSIENAKVLLKSTD